MTLLQAKLAKSGIKIGRASDIKLEQEYVPSGSLLLNSALGMPGYPKGKIVEIYGPESSGKSLITLIAEAIVTRKQKYVFHWDGEDNHNTKQLNKWRDVFGINQDYVIQQPKCSGEKLIDAVHETIKIYGKDLELIVIDSLGAIIPGKVLDRAGGETLPGKSAALIKELCKKLNIENNYAAVLMINQITSNFGYGADTTTIGGWGPKYFAAVRMQVKGNPILGKGSDADGAVGHEMTVTIKKNKMAPPRKVANLTFTNSIGCFDILSELIELAVDAGIVKKTPPWYKFKDQTFKGEPAFKEYLRANRKLLKAIIKRVTNVDWKELLE